MMNYFWGSRREVVPNNGTIRAGEQPYNQLLNTHQPLGGQLRTPPQGMLPRPQNYPSRPNNFIQGNYRENNNTVDAKTQPMVPFGSSSNNNSASMIAAARYGRMMMPPALPPRAPPQPRMSARNIPLSIPPSHIDSPQSSSSLSGGVCGLQAFAKSYASGFPSPSKTTFHNEKNLPYLPSGESSNRMNNNPSAFINDLNPHPRVDMNNNFHGVKKDVVLALPAPSLASVQINNLDHLKDSTRERSMKRPVPPEIQEADDDITKRSRMIDFAPPNNHYEGVQSRKVELKLFKDDDKCASYTPEIPTDAKEDDEEELDLSLHL